MPLPLPLLEEVSHDALLEADHAQPPAVVTVNEPEVEPDPTEVLVGESEYVHVPPLPPGFRNCASDEYPWSRRE